jgi:hypothetical protein
MTSWDKKMSKQDTAGKRQCVILISQKFEIIRRFKCGKSHSVVMTSYNIGSSTVCDIKEQEDQLQSSVASSVKCVGSFEVTDFEVS